MQQLNQYLKPLEECGFTQEQVFTMLNQNGGSNILSKVKQYADTLKAKDFTPNQIVSLFRHGKSKAFKFMLDNYEKFQQLNYTPEELVKFFYYPNTKEKLEFVLNKKESNTEEIFSHNFISFPSVHLYRYLGQKVDNCILILPATSTVHSMYGKKAQIKSVKTALRFKGEVKSNDTCLAIMVETGLWEKLSSQTPLPKEIIRPIDLNDFTSEKGRYYRDPASDTCVAYLKCDSTPQEQLNANRLAVIGQRVQQAIFGTGESIPTYEVEVINGYVRISNYGALIETLQYQNPEKYSTLPNNIEELALISTDQSSRESDVDMFWRSLIDDAEWVQMQINQQSEENVLCNNNNNTYPGLVNQNAHPPLAATNFYGQGYPPFGFFKDQPREADSQNCEAELLFKT